MEEQEPRSQEQQPSGEATREPVSSAGVEAERNEKHNAYPAKDDAYYCDSQIDHFTDEFFGWIRSQNLRLPEAIMAFSSIVMLVVIGWQVYSSPTSSQTNQLIEQAKIQANAAEKFRIAAEGINSGIGQAVGKLNLQAGELEKNAIQTSRLAAAAIQGNQLSKDAVEAQLGANRPILEIEGLGPPQSENMASGPGPTMGGILHADGTTFQFRLNNTGPGEAQNVRYAISQPHGVRGDYPNWMIKRSVEMGMEQVQGGQLGSVPITRKISNIFGHAQSDLIEIKANNLIPMGNMAVDYAEYFYGELDWDDIIGFGHHWRRKFCFLVTVPVMSRQSIVDCGARQEGVYAREGSKEKYIKPHSIDK